MIRSQPPAFRGSKATALEEHGHVENPAPGLWELVDDPREGVDATTPSGQLENVRQQRDAYERDLEDARGEINALVEEIETLQDRLDGAPDREEIEDLEAACEEGDRTGVDVALNRLRKAAGLNGDIEG